MATKEKNTTGETVVGFSDMGTTITVYRDGGLHTRALPEYNVRRLETLEVLDGLTITSPAYNAIADRSGYYGSGWGDIGGVMIVTADDLAALRAESQRVLSARNEARNTPSQMDYPDSPVCPKCGTYCWGDCEAN